MAPIRELSALSLYRIGAKGGLEEVGSTVIADGPELEST